MKPMAVLLLNLATVAVALVIYDQVVREGPPSTVNAEPGVAHSAGLERRVEALESERGPALRGAGIEPYLLERLDALENAVQARAVAADPATRDEVPTEARPATYDLAADREQAEEPSQEDVRRWRQVRDEVRRQETVERNRRRFNKALDKLAINLTPRQRDKIHTAYAEFEPRLGEIWGEAKVRAQETVAAGGHVDRATVVAETTSIIQQEFAETITGIVHYADAEAVAGAMLSKGR